MEVIQTSLPHSHVDFSPLPSGAQGPQHSGHAWYMGSAVVRPSIFERSLNKGSAETCFGRPFLGCRHESLLAIINSYENIFN